MDNVLEYNRWRKISIFNNEVLLEDLRKVGKLEVKQNQKGTCDVVLERCASQFLLLS